MKAEYSEIPEELRPLYRAPNASEVLKSAKLLMRESYAEKQREYLDSEAFVNIVMAALDGVDEDWTEHIEELIDACDEDNRELAEVIFFGV